MVLLAVGVLVIARQAVVRQDEATLAGQWFGVVLHGAVGTTSDVVSFPWSGGPIIGLQISPECTVALLLAPLCALGAILLLLSRAPWYRYLAGLVAGLATAIVVNQIRIAMIAVSLQNWGMPGFNISHTIVGTLFALAGFAVAVALMVRISIRSPRGARVAS